MANRKVIAFVLVSLIVQAVLLFPERCLCTDTRQISQAARTFLIDRLSVPYDSVAIRLEVPDIDQRTGITSWAFDLYSDRPVIGTVPFRMTLTFADGTEKTYVATARVRVFKKVAVAARRLGRHEVINSDDIRIEKRDITFMTDAYFETHDLLTGKRTKRVINAGTILAASDVEDIPVIERGSNVMVSVVIGAVTVTSKARALQDGSLGDHILVQDLTTGKRLTGTVVGKGLVVLDGKML